MHTAPLKTSQHGAALLIMAVILVVGVSAVLLTTLNSTGIMNARQNNTANALAQAKQALIARATQDGSVLGSLPCPDGNNDGSADLLVGNDCPSYIGRLPWKTLAIDDLRDAQGERLWYALSRNFRDDNSNHINSDTLGTLNLTGTQTASQLIAIVFAAGSPLVNQTRSTSNTLLCNGVNQSEALCAQNYLEASNALPSKAAALNTSYQINAPSNTFNDQAIYLTHEQLFPVIEMRIGREVKACLDGYAAASNNKYPWAVPAQNLYLEGKTNTQFGRIPYQKPITDNKIQEFLDALANLQAQVNACVTADNNNNSNALDNAGNALENAAKDLKKAQTTSPAIPSTVTNPAEQAGDKAQKNNMCGTINGNPASNSVQTNLNSATTKLSDALAGILATSNSDNTIKCDALFQRSYWKDWRNSVFYQVDDKYKPTGNATGNGAITINGQGSYRATVLVARQQLTAQNRSLFNDPPLNYLEGGNAHTASNPASSFISNRPVSADFGTVNDLVLCLDGQQICH
ncbi:MAG: type IV pilus modification PilV family protein [Gallionella sp.]